MMQLGIITSMDAVYKLYIEFRLVFEGANISVASKLATPQI